jgi:hypothetical protein
MRSRFVLLPVATVAMAAPAFATTYLTVEQAQALMFPGAALTPDLRTLTDDQVEAIEKASDANVLDRTLRAWRASTGGWFVVDQVVGKHEFIAFALALDPDGAVRSVEILDYRESYGSQIREPGWRAQFTGKKHGAVLRLNDNIKNISGATLSCRHLTDGIRRLLATYAIVLARPGG